jgi:hypothetical protein
MLHTKLYIKSRHTHYVRQRVFPRLTIHNNLALLILLCGRETWAISEGDKSEVKSAEVKYTLQDYKTN